MKPLAAIIALAIMGSLTHAQAPLLEVSTTNDGRPALKNIHTKPATAYVLEWKENRDGGTATVIGHADLLRTLGPPGTPVTLEPGTTDEWRWAPRKAANYRVLAVLYADGTSAGDAAWIARLIDFRQFFYNDAAEGIRLVREFEQQPDAKLEELYARFKQRAQQHDVELQAKVSVAPAMSPVRDLLCTTFYRNLAIEPRNAPVPDPRRLLTAKSTIQEIYDQLDSSLPLLARTNVPDDWRTSARLASIGVPPLETKWRPSMAYKPTEVRLRNTYGAAATAWTLQYAYSDGTPPRKVGWDTMVYPKDRTFDIGAGATHYTGLPGDRHTVQDVRLLAVVYADGSTAGEPGDVERLLAQRRYRLATIPRILEMIAQASEQAEVDGAALATRLRTCAGKDPEWIGQTDNRPSENLCGELASRVERAASIKELLQTERARLQQTYDRVRTSKPSLQ